MDAIMDDFCHFLVEILAESKAESNHCNTLLNEKQSIVSIDPFFASGYPTCQHKSASAAFHLYPPLSHSSLLQIP